MKILDKYIEFAHFPLRFQLQKSLCDVIQATMVWVLGRTTFDMCLDCRLRDLGWTLPSFSLEKHLSSYPHWLWV